MKIEYTLAARRPTIRTEMVAPEPIARRRPPRVACLLALAHRFEELVRSGAIRDYADLARLGGVSPARVSQILKMLTLAPSIQEFILDLPPRVPGEKCITERHLRQVLREPRWDRQHVLFEKALRWPGRVVGEQAAPKAKAGN